MKIGEFLDTLHDFRGNYLDRHDMEITSSEEFYDLQRKISGLHTIPNPRLTFIIFTVGIPLIGVWIWWEFGARRPLVLILIGMTFLELVLPLGTIYWFDSRFWRMIPEMSDAFVNDEDEFYRYFGQMVQRIYDSNPFSQQITKRYVHIPTVLFWIFWYLLIIFVLLPSLHLNLAMYTPLWWYSRFVAGIFAVLGAPSLWTFLVALFYLGYHISEHSGLKVSTVPTKRIDRVGFKVFGIFLTKVVLFTLVNLLVLTMFIVILKPGLPLYLILLFQSIIVIVPFFTYQYGLHKIMVRSKYEQLERLESAYENNLSRWFDGRVPNNDYPKEIEPILVVKREIEDLPEWPTDVKSVATVLTASLAPTAFNLLITLLL